MIVLTFASCAALALIMRAATRLPRPQPIRLRRSRRPD